MQIRRPLDSGHYIARPRDDFTKRPEQIIRIALPVCVMRVEEHAGPRRRKIFVNLAANIAQIDIGFGRVAHIRQLGRSEVDDDLARLGERFPLCFCRVAGVVE